MEAHIHFISPHQCENALHSGLTTMLGGGTCPTQPTLANWGVTTYRVCCPWQTRRIGKLEPCVFGAKPEGVLMGCARGDTAVMFVSQTSLAAGPMGSLGLKKNVMAVEAPLRIGKREIIHNADRPQSDANPVT